MHTQEYSVDIGGKTLTAIFSDLADQAHGSVILRYGNSAVLATAVMSEGVKEEAGYFPLTVDYEEKFYAAGAILGSRFMRREGRPTDEAILSGRVVDRTIRPLFDQRIRNEVQVVITILSIDEDDPDVLAIIAASLALGTSDIPWRGPVSAVRIGKVGDGHIVNPTYAEREQKDNEFDLLVCGKDGSINMIEVGAREAGEGVLTDALKKALEAIDEVQAFQKKIIAEIGKEKRTLEHAHYSRELVALFEKNIAPKLEPALFRGPGKKTIYELKDEWLAIFKETLPEENARHAEAYFEEAISALIHKAAIEKEKRADGRALNEIRPLFAQAGGVSDIIHGTGIFYRGGTHILSALTLGGPGDSQIIDNMEARDTEKRFMHHYNFPPFSTGETGRIGGANRRMIGHGALAEKALLPVIPTQDEFPYTIRIVSEAMASNGSTSMGSVCASTLALMDGGVPIKKPVAGVAMGLMLGEDGKYKVLTDIQGPEDEHGDMDCKVAGTRDGVTAVQMDVKVEGVSIKILTETFDEARKARFTILDCLEGAIPKPRETISPRAPKIAILSVKEEQIGLVIGPGGKTINGIKDATGVEDITITDDGTVYITGKSGVDEARKIIEEMTHEYKAGERFDGVVTRVLDFGAFVRIGHNTEGLVHISELAPFRVNRVEDIVSVGETVPVIIKEIDGQDRINLSIKRADPDFAARKGAGEKTGEKESPRA
ncbi:polyribonucleotide nucleotidyltransferase [Candidatus Kaiserbacteria bacterium]|nr:polyribonucleotide nucleotidyltransferase [Candidatus Kaiserbacteria bacterium]